jgi:hypothetical protein
VVHEAGHALIADQLGGKGVSIHFFTHENDNFALGLTKPFVAKVVRVAVFLFALIATPVQLGVAASLLIRSTWVWWLCLRLPEGLRSGLAEKNMLRNLSKS